MTTDNIHLKSFLSGNTLSQKIEEVESFIRSKPNDFQYRWQLFLLLCVIGNWERALQQLQFCAKVDASFEKEAQALRWLIKCEHLREDIFSHSDKTPSIWEGQNKEWMLKLAQALQLNNDQQVEQADQLREEALALCPESIGTINGEAFEWITDSDSRLGPICEVYYNQNYWWLSFADIAHIHFYKPQTLIDLIWHKTQFVLKDQTTFMAYVPVRYPLTKNDHDDRILLSQYTSWEEFGETLVVAKGQKVLTTNQTDYSILDCQEIILNK